MFKCSPKNVTGNQIKTRYTIIFILAVFIKKGVLRSREDVVCIEDSGCYLFLC